MVVGNGLNQTFSITVPLAPPPTANLRSVEPDPNDTDLIGFIETLTPFFNEFEYLGTTINDVEQTKTHMFSFHSMKQVVSPAEEDEISFNINININNDIEELFIAMFGFGVGAIDNNIDDITIKVNNKIIEHRFKKVHELDLEKNRTNLMTPFFKDYAVLLMNQMAAPTNLGDLTYLNSSIEFYTYLTPGQVLHARTVDTNPAVRFKPDTTISVLANSTSGDIIRKVEGNILNFEPLYSVRDTYKNEGLSQVIISHEKLAQQLNISLTENILLILACNYDVSTVNEEQFFTDIFTGKGSATIEGELQLEYSQFTLPTSFDSTGYTPEITVNDSTNDVIIPNKLELGVNYINIPLSLLNSQFKMPKLYNTITDFQDAETLYWYSPLIDITDDEARNIPITEFTDYLSTVPYTDLVIIAKADSITPNDLRPDFSLENGSTPLLMRTASGKLYILRDTTPEEGNLTYIRKDLGSVPPVPEFVYSGYESVILVKDASDSILSNIANFVYDGKISSTVESIPIKYYRPNLFISDDDASKIKPELFKENWLSQTDLVSTQSSIFNDIPAKHGGTPLLIKTIDGAVYILRIHEWNDNRIFYHRKKLVDGSGAAESIVPFVECLNYSIIFGTEISSASDNIEYPLSEVKVLINNSDYKNLYQLFATEDNPILLPKSLSITNDKLYRQIISNSTDVGFDPLNFNPTSSIGISNDYIGVNNIEYTYEISTSFNDQLSLWNDNTEITITDGNLTFNPINDAPSNIVTIGRFFNPNVNDIDNYKFKCGIRGQTHSNGDWNHYVDVTLNDCNHDSNCFVM